MIKAANIFVFILLVQVGLNAQSADSATPVRNIKAPEGFRVELVHSVTAAQHGSWVNLCNDDKGRIIASDQFGGLYRFTPPPPGKPLQPGDIKKVPARIRAANGLLWAFGALYVGVNDYERKMESGLYRLTDSNGDDQLDKVEKLRGMTARGDHGIHALLLSPDKKSIHMITGNNTTPIKADASRVPRHWGEDHLLPRMPDGRGHNRGRLAPGGIIYKISPDGKKWEIISSGYRNIFDGAFNRDGELFAYDADMEYDFNTSWYRPTRVNHVTSGSMLGWRNGTGKRPEFYPDTLPPVINIGPGSPTGVTFGYGAKFPARYQDALYILDWSWGKIHAVHMKPEGSTYTATKETFITGSPLPVSDAIIHARDGAMYFTIGGRRVQSGLYRVTYTGKESTRPVKHEPETNDPARLRHQLEKFHGGEHKGALKAAWPHLDHPDRFIRWAALTAVQHQPLEKWREQALNEKDYGKRVALLLGLCKVAASDPANRGDTTAIQKPIPSQQLVNAVYKSLAQVKWQQLNHSEQLTFIRAYQIALFRLGKPGPKLIKRIIAQLEPQFPAPSFRHPQLQTRESSFCRKPPPRRNKLNTPVPFAC